MLDAWLFGPQMFGRRDCQQHFDERVLPDRVVGRKPPSLFNVDDGYESGSKFSLVKLCSLLTHILS